MKERESRKVLLSLSIILGIAHDFSSRGCFDRWEPSETNLPVGENPFRKVATLPRRSPWECEKQGVGGTQGHLKGHKGFGQEEPNSE